MPVLQIRRSDILLQNKRYCLEAIAAFDVASALPTPVECWKTREELLMDLSKIEEELEILGFGPEDRDVTWRAESEWDWAAKNSVEDYQD